MWLEEQWMSLARQLTRHSGARGAPRPQGPTRVVMSASPSPAKYSREAALARLLPPSCCPLPAGTAPGGRGCAPGCGQWVLIGSWELHVSSAPLSSWIPLPALNSSPPNNTTIYSLRFSVVFQANSYRSTTHGVPHLGAP